MVQDGIQSAPTKVLCLIGPTGAGKTEAALTLARTFNGGVINLDSRQVYRDFPIITAQPTPEEQGACAHRLYGFMETTQRMSAGIFTDMARAAMEETVAQGLVPILVGGTGLYLRALLDGLAPIPRVSEEFHAQVGKRLQEEGLPALRKELEDIDPVYAAQIHPNDPQRTLRALEVYMSSGKPLSWWHAQPVEPTGYTGLKLGIDWNLADLTPRLERRIGMMLEAGALDEARRAMEICDDRDAPGWSGIGCAEVYAFLKGEIDMKECSRLWLRNTRAYAKRQLTWFRKEPGMQWVQPDDINEMVVRASAFLYADEDAEA